MLNWFDQRLGFRRRSGAPFEGTPLDVTDSFKPDPIVAVEVGHPAVELGFEFVLRDIVQIAMPPADDARWAERLLDPPTPDDLRRALEPHRRAFVLDDPEFPALQVRPTEERMEEFRAKRGRKDLEFIPIAVLLPDHPTQEASGDDDFFQKEGAVQTIAAGLILPLLYYHMVIFPIAGGRGYFGLGENLGFGSATKYFVFAETLWERIWLNVLAAKDSFFGEVNWSEAIGENVYPWLNPKLKRLALGQAGKEGILEISASQLHPAMIPMPRRYLLGRPQRAVCGLTGSETLCFREYTRWPDGPRFLAEGWRWWGVAERRMLAREGDGWTLKKRDFPGTRGPLRFDDWLHVALGADSPTPLNNARTVEQIEAPPAIRAFRARRRALNDAHRRYRPIATGGVRVLGAGRGPPSPMACGPWFSFLLARRWVARRCGSCHCTTCPARQLAIWP